MTIENAEQAALLVTSKQSIDTVLVDIEWAANHSHRSWQFHKLSDEILSELRTRGFKVSDVSTSDYVTVEW